MPIPMLSVLLLLFILLVIAFAFGGTLIVSLISGGLSLKRRRNKKNEVSEASEEE